MAAGWFPMSGSVASVLIVLVPVYGATFLLVSWHASPGGLAWLAPVLAVPLIWLSVTDLRRFEIPDTAIISIALCGALFQWVARPASLGSEIALALGLAAVLWVGGDLAFRRMGREALGIGDAKLIGAGTLCTGFAAIWWALLIACMGGIAAALAARRGSGNTTHLGIPFGPFLAYAIYMVFLLQLPGMPWH